jgi:HK97 family phage major capsid protein
MSIKALYEQRMAVHNKAVTYLASEKFTAEKRASFEKAMAEVKSLTEQIAKAEGRGESSFEVPDNNFKREAAFGRYLRGLTLDEAEKRSLEFRDGVVEGDVLAHIGSYTGLGFLVPTGFSNAIEEALKFYAPLADGSVFKLWETTTGNPIPYPTSNDTGNEAAVFGEAASITEKDVTADQIIFGAYKLSSGIVKASLELIQDSAFGFENWLADLFAIRFGRALESYLTNGTGSGQPLGLLPALVNAGVTPIIASGSSANDGSAATGVNSIGYGDLVNLEHAVDPAYRRSASYMFHDLTLSKLQQLLDKYGRPLWQPGVAADVPDTINGHSYTINQAMPQVGASNVCVAFGDMSKYVVRKVAGFSVIRLNELYAANGQVGFLSNARYDANLLDAGTHPIAVLQNHS